MLYIYYLAETTSKPQVDIAAAQCHGNKLLYDEVKEIYQATLVTSDRTMLMLGVNVTMFEFKLTQLKDHAMRLSFAECD